MILGNVPAGTCEGGTLRISSVTTLRLREYPNLCYVALETDDGLTGIGETFFGARAVAAWVHETAAAYLLGKDPRAIQRHSRALEGFVGSAGTGTENRGRSAVDIALWDLLGRHTGLPLYQLLGGLARESVPIYNTCAGPTYVRELPDSPDLPVSNWSSRRQSPTDARPSSVWAVRSRMVPLRPRVPGQGPARRRDHGDENLALRRVRRALPAASTSPSPTSSAAWSPSGKFARRQATKSRSSPNCTRNGTSPPR